MIDPSSEERIPTPNEPGIFSPTPTPGSVKAPGEPEAAPPRVRMRIPISPPRVTYVLLGAIGVAFLAQTLLGGSTETMTLIRMGAQVNTLVAQGDAWRLFTAMFLHIGLAHVAFNAWALFSVGRDVEGFYGSVRFLVIYLLTGLAGNVAYYVFGRDGLSAGASGAVFGVIGAEVGYFIVHRDLFGSVGRQRLSNLAILIGINLIFGFSVPGINNLAHLGGLLSGILLGIGLAPHYDIQRDPTLPGFGEVRIRRLGAREILVVALLVLALLAGWMVGNRRWQSSATMLRSQAEAAYDAGDLVTAQSLLEQAVAREPDELTGLFNLGVVYIQQNRPVEAIEVLERARSVDPEDANTLFTLGVAYASTGQAGQARPLLEAFIAKEPEGERSAYARSLLQ